MQAPYGRLGVALTVLLSAHSLVACTSSSDEGQAPLTLALTDAASDELASFVVELEGVQLQRVGGATVGVLPQPATVDLVTLEDVSQVLNVTSVPAGLYVAATVTFDFTGASAYLIGETNPASLLDGDGNPLTGLVTLPVTLASPVNAVVGAHRLLELDFDLDLSVHVDAPANTARVEPMVVVRVDPAAPKDLVAVGDLQTVDVAGSGFAMQLQTLAGLPIGDLMLDVLPATVFQIDGVPATGAAGLLALDGLPAGTWLQCYGIVDPAGARIIAAYVEAGSGTYNGGDDIVEGHVVGRVGGAGADAMLTVLGHSNDATHTSFFFNTTFTVSASFADTAVVRRGSSVACDLDDVNVGQRVRVFGTLSGFTLDASAPGSVLRLQPTRVLGFANAAIQTGVLDFDLVRVGLRDETAFAWNEGGTTPPDPDATLASVGSLGQGLSIGATTAVEILGFFSAVDDAQEDFVASALVNRDLAPSLLFVHNLPNGFDVSTTVSPTQIQIAVTGAPGPFEAAVVDRGFVGVVPLPDTPTPTVVPAGSLGLYAICDRVNGVTSLHLTFDAFATVLDALLAQGAVVRTFAGVGNYDAPSNTTSVFLVSVVVE